MFVLNSLSAQIKTVPVLHFKHPLGFACQRHWGSAPYSVYFKSQKTKRANTVRPYYFVTVKTLFAELQKVCSHPLRMQWAVGSKKDGSALRLTVLLHLLYIIHIRYNLFNFSLSAYEPYRVCNSYKRNAYIGKNSHPH